MSLWTFLFACLLLGFTYDVIVKAMQRRNEGRGEEEVRTLQEIHKLLTRLEERVEALETIVIDQTKESDFYRRLSS
jgi:phage shock protein B